jgi:hypothetical protein
MLICMPMRAPSGIYCKCQVVYIHYNRIHLIPYPIHNRHTSVFQSPFISLGGKRQLYTARSQKICASQQQNTGRLTNSEAKHGVLLKLFMYKTKKLYWRPLVNDQHDAQFFTMYLFLFLTLYMFRAHLAHHQERHIVSTQPLVTVTLCRWPCRVQVRSQLPTCTWHGHRQ